MIPSRLGVTVCLSVALCACADPMSEPAIDATYAWANPPGCDSAAPVVSLPAPQRDSLPGVPSPGRFTDEVYYNIAQHVPGGFAGWYFDGKHRFTINFVDTTDLAASLDSLAPYWTRTSLDRDSVSIKVVRWNWTQLNDWYRYILLVHGLPEGLTMADINEVTNRLEFGAYPATARDQVLQRLAGLGVPCWLAAAHVQPPAVLK